MYGEPTEQILSTKDQFIATLRETTPENIVRDLLSSTLDNSLLLQHCMLATDVGKETLDRLAFFLSYNEVSELDIETPELSRTYTVAELSDDNFSVANRSFANFSQGAFEDIFTVLAFGSDMTLLSEYVTFDRCRLGEICGDETAIADYFADLYILFSDQTKGRVRVKKGQAPERLVKQTLNEVVAHSQLSLVSSSRVPNVPTQGEDQEFDFVLTDGNRYVAIEVAFQETTNSTLERKARQSRELYPVFEQRGSELIHVVDGAGYFERSNALQQMVEYSHLAVSLGELDDLSQHLTQSYSV
jgi:hypothetical protein